MIIFLDIDRPSRYIIHIMLSDGKQTKILTRYIFEKKPGKVK